jgi:hypothetical protein
MRNNKHDKILQKRAELRDKAERIRPRIEKVICIKDWEFRDSSVIFKSLDDITLAELNKLSEELGTDAINFNFGSDGEEGYSEYTPSSPGSPGYIEVMLEGIKEP